MTPYDLKTRVFALGKRVEQALRDNLAIAPDPATIAKRGPEPPVVARLIVEIRSDGSRTIARGAIEDPVAEQRVAIEAHGTTPIELAASLARSMVSLPRLAAALNSVRRGKRADDDF